MENGLEPHLTLEELKLLYRNARGNFLTLHRIMCRLGIVSDQERIQIYDLTKKVN